MKLVELILIAVGLSMDAFAVSLGAGTHDKIRGPRPVFRLAFHFGLFQFLMTAIGWHLGTGLEKYIATVDHWIAFGLLAIVGMRMIAGGFEKPEVETKGNPSKGLTLVSLSVATSLDALAIGISLGMIKSPVWFPSVFIGVVTALLSYIGVKAGGVLGEKFGKRMEIVGGLILVLIGLRIGLSGI